MLVYACGVWYGGKCKGTHNLACCWVGGLSIVWIWEALIVQYWRVDFSFIMCHTCSSSNLVWKISGPNHSVSAFSK